jgi:hypothetical protein
MPTIQLYINGKKVEEYVAGENTPAALEKVAYFTDAC